MTAPIVPPAGRDPAGPGQREAARDYLTRLRQQGGTYRSIADAAVLSPEHRLRPGLRPQASTTGHGRRRPHGDQPGPAPGPAGRDRHPAAAARPARDGPRLGPHRPRRPASTR